MKRIFYLTIIFFTTAVFAQNNNETWQNFMYSQRITSLEEDNSHYYFGTRGGLMVIDKATNQTTFQNKASGLPSNMVEGIELDDFNSFWIGTYDGGLVQRTGQTSTIFTAANSLLPSDVVYKVKVDPNGTVYAATQGGMVKKQGQQWTVVPVNHLSSWFAERLILDNSRGSAWVLTDHAIFEMDMANNIIEHNNSLNITYTIFRDLRMDGNNNLFLTDGTRLWKHNGSWTELDLATIPGTGNISKMAVNGNGNIVLLRDGDLITETTTGWTMTSLASIGAPNSYFSMLEYDNSGNLWLADGEYLYQYKNGNWTSFAHSNAPLTTNHFIHVAADNMGNTYAMEFNGRLVKYNGTTWNVIPLPSQFTMTNKTEMLVDQNNKLVISTDVFGLFIYDGSTWTNYNMTNSGMPDNEIWAMDIDAQNYIWMGTPSNGVIKYDGINFTNYNIYNSNLPDNEVHAIAAANDGDVWIATDAKAYLTQLDGNNIINHNIQTYWGNNRIWTLETDKNNDVWIGSYNSDLVKFNGQNFTTFTPGGSNTTKETVKITFDPEGNLWLGKEDDGIAKFDGQNYTFYKYKTSPLTSNKIKDLTFSGNDLWILTDPNYSGSSGGNGGITVFSPILNPVNIKDPITSNVLIIYPNPAHNLVTINISNAANADISLYNITGSKISANATAVNDKISLNVSQLTPGIYFVEISSDNKKWVEKLVVK